MVDRRYETRECHLCHRSFVAYGDWAWCCTNDRACASRRAKRDRAALKDAADEQ